MNGTKIANRTVPLFWYPSVRVPSTAKGTKMVELNSLQNIDWLTRIVTCACYKGIKLLLHSFHSAVFGLLLQSAQTQNNITVYFIILYFHTDKPFPFLWTCETSLPKNRNFQNITVICVMKCSFKSFSGENVVV